MVCDAFYVTVFKSLRFHLSTLETGSIFKTMYFQKSPLLKPFSSKVAVVISVFGRFSVDDGRNRIKTRYVFKRKRVNVDGA